MDLLQNNWKIIVQISWKNSSLYQFPELALPNSMTMTFARVIKTSCLPCSKDVFVVVL